MSIKVVFRLKQVYFEKHSKNSTITMNSIVISLFFFFTIAFASSIYEYPENSFFVTMPKSELMAIQDCINERK